MIILKASTWIRADTQKDREYHSLSSKEQLRELNRFAIDYLRTH